MKRFSRKQIFGFLLFVLLWAGFGFMWFDTAIRSGNINKEQWVIPFGDMGAQINAAVSAIGASNPGTIHIADGGGSCTTTAVLGQGQNLVLGAGTYTCLVRLPDSNSAPITSAVYGKGRGITFLQAPSGTNADVIANLNFSSFTGGVNFFGTFRVTLSDLTVDCNEPNNTTSGYAIRLYGRAYVIRNVVAQNCKNDGVWLEWGGAESDTAPNTSIEAYIDGLETQYNLGSGLTHKGPSDTNITNFKSHNNSVWGWDEFTSAHFENYNGYENTLGATKIEASSGGIFGSDGQFTTATGTGLLIVNGSGGSAISASLWTGPVGVEIDGSVNALEGVFANTATAAILFNNAAANKNFIIGTAVNNSGTHLAFTAGGGNDYIALAGSAPNAATLSTGSIPSLDSINVSIAHTPSNLVFFQLPSFTINVGGWAPQLPQTNSVLAALGIAETFVQPQTMQTDVVFTERTPGSAASGFDACSGDSPSHTLKCSYNNGTFLPLQQVISTSFTTTAAASDNVTVTGMTASGHCYLTPTNTGAAAGIASVFISAKTTNQITASHTATSGWTFDVVCTPQ